MTRRYCIAPNGKAAFASHRLSSPNCCSIADTFTDSLARLTGDEQKAVKTTAFDLQMNAASTGMSFHRLDKARDKNFWSVRVSGDVRIIVHKTRDSLLLCYVNHHDSAYAWAERRKLETHPTTGAAQLVELRETHIDVTLPTYVAPSVSGSSLRTSAPPAPIPLFAKIPDATLLACGVPVALFEVVRCATDDSIFAIAEQLPSEAAEALLEIATGGTPTLRATNAPAADPFAHPDAMRRFRTMANAEELERALAFPWDRWSVFLHPAQQDMVDRHYSGPARVAGSAGTGKTVVALHRAVRLARTNPSSRVLLTTFSISLARMLRQKLQRLVGDDSALAARITVDAIDEIGIALYEQSFGTPKVAPRGMIRSLLASLSADVGGHTFSDRSLEQEFADVVDAWQLRTWDAYRDVIRLGRKNRLSEKQRASIWPIFEQLQQRLHDGHWSLRPHFLANSPRRWKPALNDRSIWWWWTKRRMSVCRNCAFSRHSRPTNLMDCSSPAILDNGSFRRPSRGSHSALTFADVPARYASITAHRIRFVVRPIGCWSQRWPTSTASWRADAGPYPRSTAQIPG